MDRLRESRGLGPVDRFVIVQVFNDLAAEHLEDLVEFIVQTAIGVDVLQNSPGLSHSFLNQVQLLHPVEVFGVGLRV